LQLTFAAFAHLWVRLCARSASHKHFVAHGLLMHVSLTTKSKLRSPVKYKMHKTVTWNQSF